MKHFLSFSVLVSLLFSFTSPALALVVKVPDTGTDTKVCIQVIQNAKNSTTGECQAFSTPCDVPAGWTPVQKCSLPDAAKVVEPKFEVKKFNSCSELEDTLVNIFERYQSNYWSPYGPYMMKGGMALDMAVPVPTGSPVTNSVRAKGELTQSTIGDK